MSQEKKLMNSMQQKDEFVLPNIPVPRFVRLNPRFDRKESLDLLQSEITSTHPDNRYPLQVPWLLSQKKGLEFFIIPGDFSLNKTISFQSGRVYGMDVTSGATVALLLMDEYDGSELNKDFDPKVDKKPIRVLDLCCAPGLKLCMMADLLPLNSLVVGVDSSESRLSLCKNIIRKYHIDETTSGINSSNTNGDRNCSKETTPPHVRIRLFWGDGTTFGDATQSPNHQLVFDSTAAIEDQSTQGKRKRMNKSARAREKRRLLELSSDAPITKEVNTSYQGDAGKTHCNTDSIKEVTISNAQNVNSLVESFDRVLVDAECSSDGAVRHIQKRQSSMISKHATWDNSNMDELVNLQRNLIDSGFRLLKRGGIMVYSTCSLSSRQNEEVVNWLLNKYKTAYIIPVSFSKHYLSAGDSPELQFIKEGTIKGTVRFTPTDFDDNSISRYLSSGVGFFVAKLGKTVQIL